MVSRIRLPEQNLFIMTGRLTQDPDLRYTAKNQAVCRFSIAVNRSYKDANDTWQKDASFIPIVSWRDIALLCSQKLKKGDPVFINGRLKSREWEDKSGQKHRTLEVELARIQFLNIQESTEKNNTVPEAVPEKSSQPVALEETEIPVEEEPF